MEIRITGVGLSGNYTAIVTSLLESFTNKKLLFVSANNCLECSLRISTSFSYENHVTPAVVEHLLDVL